MQFATAARKMLGGAGVANAVRDGGAKNARGCRGRERSDQRRREKSHTAHSDHVAMLKA